MFVNRQGYCNFTIPISKILEQSDCNMLEDVVNDYSSYFKLDVINEFQTVQDVVDNMLTRLEELTSVLQMIKLKNTDCNKAVSEDISKYRAEITTLSKKIAVVSNVILKLQRNVDLIEKQVEKAELDFGVNTDNKIKSFLKPFLKKSKDVNSLNNTITPPGKVQLDSVLGNFDNTNAF